MTTAAEIRALSPERAEQALPVAVHGVITCAGSLIFIEDQTAGIFVDVPVSSKGRYQVGQYGLLQGYTAPGLFAPQIVPARFAVSGNTPLPTARVAKFDELSTGKLDSQRVEIAGIIRAVLPDERPDLRRTITLKMASDDGVFPVTVPDLSPDKLRVVADAAVRVRGVVGGVFNERRQMIGIKLYVGQADDLIIDEPGRAEPYAVPATPLERLLRFQPEGQSRHRVRVVGTVTLVHPGVVLYVEDGTGGVAVRARQVDALAVGDQVQVLGFPEMGPWTPYLNDAVFRRDGVAVAPVVPISVTADQELSAGSHDSRLVSVDAELVDVVADAGRLLLVAKSKNIVFDAEVLQDRIAAAGGGGTPTPLAIPLGLRNGSRVHLTGISDLGLTAEREHPSRFRLLLRGLDDVVVLQKPPWLTLSRLLGILIGLGALTTLAVGWGVVLRRRVRAQTAVIRRQLDDVTTLEQRYSELFDNANDIIYTHDTAGRLLTVNRAAEILTGYSRDELLRQTILDLALPERREAILKWLKNVGEGRPGRSTFEWELVARNGRFVPVEVSIRPLMDGTRIKAIEGVARDITQRKRGEAELAAAHRRLVETSRRAGMAEVAAGVLHNVGNVLTSVTASANRLADQLRGSKDEHAAIAQEVESLGRSVDHIKEIVAMQQGYARVSGVREEIAATTLIEDALRINRETLERHKIAVVRDFAPAPPMLIEKHKVLEILVNLLSNAKYACDQQSGGAPARITVRVETPKGERAGDRVRIVVADNGIGIPHDDLGRIFENGFTTRQGGNGVGLHTASMTARELGGSLFVHSDGVGKGCRFTLDLPVQSPARPGVQSLTLSNEARRV